MLLKIRLMHSRRVLLFIFVLLSAPAFAGWIDREGNALPDTEFRKSNGDFGAQLVLTDKEEQTFRKWNTPSSVVDIATTNRIQVNRFLTAVIIFSGCGADNAGNCNLVVRFKILQPNGSVYADLPTQEAWVNKPAPPNRSLQMSVGYIRVRIEPHEPIGRYTMLAEVMDKNTGKTLNLTQYFDATK
jgi:hypothetical protein